MRATGPMAYPRCLSLLYLPARLLVQHCLASRLPLPHVPHHISFRAVFTSTRGKVHKLERKRSPFHKSGRSSPRFRKLDRKNHKLGGKSFPSSEPASLVRRVVVWHGKEGGDGAEGPVDRYAKPVNGAMGRNIRGGEGGMDGLYEGSKSSQEGEGLSSLHSNWRGRTPWRQPESWQRDHGKEHYYQSHSPWLQGLDERPLVRQWALTVRQRHTSPREGSQGLSQAESTAERDSYSTHSMQASYQDARPRNPWGRGLNPSLSELARNSHHPSHNVQRSDKYEPYSVAQHDQRAQNAENPKHNRPPMLPKTGRLDCQLSQDIQNLSQDEPFPYSQVTHNEKTIDIHSSASVPEPTKRKELDSEQPWNQANNSVCSLPKLDLPSIDEKWRSHIIHPKTYQSLKQLGSSPAPGPISLGSEKFYVLPMIPYPSGMLHLGHLRVYTISDVISRYRRMEGYDVLHPIGWDSFGLPAEKAAIERGASPERWIAQNVMRMKEQLGIMGAGFDWNQVSIVHGQYIILL